MERLNLILICKFVIKIKNFLHPLLDFYFRGLVKKDYKIITRDGVTFMIRPRRKMIVGDIDILSEVLLEDQYDLQQILKPGYTIIDIGGQAGFFSILSSKKIGKFGRIYTFEPFKPNFNQISKNMKINQVRNMEVENKAVSDKVGEVTLFISKQNIGEHSLLKNLKNREGINVVSTTLEEIIKKNRIKRVDVLKIDCEGSEYNILLNATRRVMKRIDTIILEQHITPYTKRYKERSITDYLKLNGFSVRELKKIYYKDEGKFLILLAKRKEEHKGSITR